MEGGGGHGSEVFTPKERVPQKRAALTSRRQRCASIRLQQRRIFGFKPGRGYDAIGPEAELTGSGRRDFAVENPYALQGDAQVLLVSTDEAGLGFGDQ